MTEGGRGVVSSHSFKNALVFNTRGTTSLDKAFNMVGKDALVVVLPASPDIAL